MNFIKSMLLKIGTGFLYGAGFAAALGVVSAVSLSHLSQKTISAEEELEELKENNDLEIDQMYKKYNESAKLIAKVEKERISINEFTLIGSLKNEGASNWSHINLKAEIFNKNGEFIDQCSEYISDKSIPGSSINFKLSCGSCSKLNLEEYHSYKLSILDASFDME